MKFVLIIAIVAGIGLIGFTSYTYAGFVATIGGTQGTGNGQFDQPWGLAVNDTGHVFVAEYWNHRVQVFDNSTSHNFLSRIVDPGVRGYTCTNTPGNCDGNGELNQPMDIEFDSSNNIWVLDLGNQRIQKFYGNGTYITQFGSSGSGDGQFYSPKDFAIDPSGNIWVADTNNNRIQKFNSAGSFLMKFGSYGQQVIQNDGTIGEDPDRDGVYTSTERHNGKFNNPVSLDFDSSGNLYVADNNNRRIQKFDSSGNYLTSFGSYGTTNGKFINPHFITIDKYNSIYVGDRERNNVQVFDDNFNFRYAITGLSDPKDIVVDKFDRLLVAYNHGVNIYTSTTGSFNKTTTTSLDFSNYYDLVITNKTNVLNSISIPSDNTAASLNFTRILYTPSGSNDKSTTFVNRLVINSTITEGDIDVIIPADTNVNGTLWDGKFKLASYAETSDIGLSGQSVDLNKKFGSDDVDLKFSKPVKMTFSGKASKNIGIEFVNGTERLISTDCVADDLTQVITQLSSGGECKIASGSDMIVYTKHFTSFFSSSTSSSSSSSSSGGGGGGGGNCDLDGLGNTSLRVYEVSYDVDTYQVLVQAYSTCGPIKAKITTLTGQSILGMSADQPLLEDNIIIYSTFLDESDKKFTISLENKRVSFTDTFNINDKSIIKPYTGDTGYTSQQEGTSLPVLTSEQTTTELQLTEIVSEEMTSEEITSEEMTSTTQVESTEYVSEPIAEKVVEQKESEGGGCLIATATYGSELAPQVQLLREIRDNNLLNTESGSAFMNTFNDIYYSFSPTIADYERENPVFKEAVKIAITPMITSLSLMENANSESEVLGLGLSVIALNLAMYIGIPAVVIVGIKKRF